MEGFVQQLQTTFDFLLFFKETRFELDTVP